MCLSVGEALGQVVPPFSSSDRTLPHVGKVRLFGIAVRLGGVASVGLEQDRHWIGISAKYFSAIPGSDGEAAAGAHDPSANERLHAFQLTTFPFDLRHA